MNSSADREKFSARLRQVLNDTGAVTDSPIALAREFNRHFGGAPVTVHSARKWLLGEAIPTQAKLRAMAHWLGVSPEWLRFGDIRTVEHIDRATPQAAADLALLADLHCLNEGDRQLAREFIRSLVIHQTKTTTVKADAAHPPAKSLGRPVGLARPMFQGANAIVRQD